MSQTAGFPRGGSDAQLAASMPVIGQLVFNGTTFDRIVSANAAQLTTGTGLLASASMVFDGTNYRRLDNSPGDGVVPGFFSPGVQWVFNGASYDRLRSANAATNNDGTGLFGVGPLIWNGASFNRVVTPTSAGDSSNGNGIISSQGFVFNGSGYDRMITVNRGDQTTGTGLLGVGLLANDNGGPSNFRRLNTNSAAALSATTQANYLGTAPPGEWTLQNSAGAGNQSTASKPAGAAGVRHVLRSFLVTANATVAGSTTINIRDGASGAGTVKFSFVLTIPTTSTAVVQMSGLNIFGTAATAMTIEQSAGVANVSVDVNASGYSTV